MLVIGNFAIEKIQSASSFISKVFENDSERIHRKIFLLPDKEIRELVAKGMDLKSDDWMQLDSINELPIIESDLRSGAEHKLPVVVFDTPQNEVVSRVYLNKHGLRRPYLSDYHSSFEDRPSYEIHFPILDGKRLSFSVEISLSKAENSPDLTFSLRQDEQEIYIEKSSRVARKEHLFYNEKETLFSDDRNIRFDADPKIVDYSKPAELYVSWDGTSDYAVYELDFQKFIK